LGNLDLHDGVWAENLHFLSFRMNNVKRAVERLSDKGIFGRPPMVDDLSMDAQDKKRTTSVYLCDKRTSMIVVAQLCPEATAKFVDRWQELVVT
jgi:phage regulator Rha-like protein